MKRLLALATIAFATIGCPKSGPGRNDAPKGAGVRIADDGEVAKVVGSPDGKWVAFLGQVERPKVLGVPEGILVGLLEVVPSDGSGPARQLLGGVTTLEGSFGFSPDGTVLAALKGFRFASHSGSLEVVKPGDAKSDPVHLADDCSGFVFSPDSKHLGWVCAAGAFLGNADGSNARKLCDFGATVDFSRDGSKLLVRQLAAAGGALLLVDVASGASRPVSDKVGDYAFSPDGATLAFTQHAADVKAGWELYVAGLGGAPQKLGDGVSRFEFAPDGQSIGYIGGVTPSKAFGDLFVAPLGKARGPGVKVAERVEQFQFAPGSQAIAFLSHFDANARSGTLGVQRLPVGATASAQTLFKPCKGFSWSPKGDVLAFSALVLKPAVSVDLEVLPLNELKPGESQPDGGTGWATGPRKVATGVFGYEFLTDTDLVYRTECIMEGRACDLFVVPTDHAATPARLTGGVWRFAISKDRQRMLVTYPRVDSETVADLGALNLSGYGGVVGVDKSVELGAQLLDAHGDRAAYGVIDKRRRGVYVAKVPLPEAGQLPPSLEPPGFKATYGVDAGAR